jgi:S-DNA-T family DNA segregation ATPase FtsK/SpoIIIE
MGFKQAAKESLHQLVWSLGYHPLVPPKHETIVEIIQKSIRTRPGRELEAEIENIMFELHLYNGSGEYAMHLNTVKKAENHFITMWQLPRGLTYRKYQDQREVFCNNLKAQVIIEERNGSMMIEVIQGVLPSKKGFEFDISKYPDMLLPVMIGWDQAGPVVIDLQKLPHLLITGTTGTGKSVSMQNIILSLANNSNAMLYGCDIGRVNMAFIADRAVFAKDIFESLDVISYLVSIMNERLQIIESIPGCVDIVGYNEANHDNKLPFLVLLIDEFGFTSEKMTRIKEEKELRRDIYTKIAGMAQLARKTVSIW